MIGEGERVAGSHRAQSSFDGSRVVGVAAAVQVKGQLAGVLEGRGNGRRCLRSSVVGKPSFPIS